MKSLLHTIGLILAESRYRRACRALRRATAEHTVAKARLIRRYRADAHDVQLAAPIISTTANARPAQAGDAYVWRPFDHAKVKATKGGHRRH